MINLIVVVFFLLLEKRTCIFVTYDFLCRFVNLPYTTVRYNSSTSLRLALSQESPKVLSHILCAIIHLLSLQHLQQISDSCLFYYSKWIFTVFVVLFLLYHINQASWSWTVQPSLRNAWSSRQSKSLPGIHIDLWIYIAQISLLLHVYATNYRVYIHICNIDISVSFSLCFFYKQRRQVSRSSCIWQQGTIYVFPFRIYVTMCLIDTYLIIETYIFFFFIFCSLIMLTTAIRQPGASGDRYIDLFVWRRGSGVWIAGRGARCHGQGKCALSLIIVYLCFYIYLRCIYHSELVMLLPHNQLQSHND